MKEIEVVESIVEFHIGDCSCEQEKGCTSCVMKQELKELLKQTRLEALEESAGVIGKYIFLEINQRRCYHAESIREMLRELATQIRTLAKKEEKDNG